MTITSGRYEDVSDFMTEALLCKKCKQETPIVGPLPSKPQCPQCGSTSVVRVSAQASGKSSDRRAA